MPTYTLENKDTWSKTAVEICSAKGLTKEEIQALGMAAGNFGFAVSDYLVNDNGIDYISKNIFDSGLFVWECANRQTGLTQDQFSIKRSFNTVVELYEYLLSENFVKDVEDADAEAGDLSLFAAGIVEILKSLNFKYQTTPLTADEIGVVAQETYDYYIYNGKEWVGVGSSVDTSRLTNTINIQPTDTVLSDSDYALYKQNPYGTTIVESEGEINTSYRCFEGSNNAFIATSFISDGYIKEITIDSSSPHTITRQTIKLDVPSDVRDTVNHSISIEITLDSNDNPSWTDSEKEKFLNAIEVGNLNRVGLSFPYYGGVADVCATYNGSFSFDSESQAYIFSTAVIPDILLDGDDYSPISLAITVLVNSDNTTSLSFFDTNLRHEEREVNTIVDIYFNAEPGQQGIISSDEASKITLALLHRSLVEIQVGNKLYSFQSGRVIQSSGSVSLDDVIYFSNVEKTDTDVIINTLKIDTQNLTYIITSSIIPKESPNPICYDTNETIDFSFLLGIYVDAGNFGKIQPFKNIDTLLSSEAIKAIIDENYKMFSFNAKVNEDVMTAYMSISYYSVANNSDYYTFKGQVTFLNNGWNTIDVQMQFIHNPTTGSYTNNPGYGFFRYTKETAVGA